MDGIARDVKDCCVMMPIALGCDISISCSKLPESLRHKSKPRSGMSRA